MSIDLKNFAKLKKEYKAKIKKDGKVALKNALKDFFDKHPEVDALLWTQYTPYFNDGEPCEFSVHDACIKFKDLNTARSFLKNECTWEYDYNTQKLIRPLTDEELEENQEDEGGGWSDWDLKDGPLKKELEQFNNQLGSNADLLEEVLGDHIRVVASKNKIDVNEYEHD